MIISISQEASLLAPAYGTNYARLLCAISGLKELPRSGLVDIHSFSVRMLMSIVIPMEQRGKLCALVDVAYPELKDMTAGMKASIALHVCAIGQVALVLKAEQHYIALSAYAVGRLRDLALKQRTSFAVVLERLALATPVGQLAFGGRKRRVRVQIWVTERTRTQCLMLAGNRSDDNGTVARVLEALLTTE